MKYSFNIFLITMLVFYSHNILFAQAGKVPNTLSSGKFSNYSIEGPTGGTLAYGHSSIRAITLSMPIPEGTPFDSLNSFTFTNFASSMVLGGDEQLYIIDWTPAIYTLNISTGAVTFIGNITGLAGNTPNGIAYNSNTGIYYLATGTHLYSLNMTNFQATEIGPFNLGGLMIDLAVSCEGICYGYDITTDSAYTIDLSTGNAAGLGPLGYDAGFGQGIDIDRETGRIYLSAFNITTNTGQLRTMDPVTGNTTLVVDWGFEQVAPFVINIPYETVANPPSALTADPVSTSEIQLTWNDDSDNEEGFEIQRRSGIVYITIGTVGSDITTYTDTGRTSGTEYCYRVRAFNCAGNSSFTTDACATTITPPTDPSQLNASGISSSEIELTWIDNSDNEDGFEIQRETLIFTFVTIGTVGSNVTTFVDTGRVTGTEYCYRVMAFNAGGSSGFTPEACATISENLPGVPVLSLPANTSTQVSVTPVLEWETSVNTDTYTLQISLNNSFNPAFEFAGIIDTTFSVPSQTPLPHNSTFYWKVMGVNTNGSGAWSPPWSFTTLTTMDLSSTVTFPNRTNPGDYTATEYKIVGLPGNGNINVSTILSGSQGADWEVYNDNDEDSNYYMKFDAGNPFRFVAGKSFWIIRKGNLSINQTVTAATVNESGYVEINLVYEDFNLITNPFLVAVPWSAVLTLNGLPPTTPLRHYNGGWSNTNTMVPFTGYLFDNTTDLSTLRIPYPIGGSSLPKQNNTDLWRVTVDLSSGELFDKTTAFGVSEEALQEYDKLDFRKPRAPGNIPVVYFHRPNWDKGYGLYSTDMRPEFEEIQIWDFKVNSELREQIKLTFGGISEIPDQMEIYLVDDDRAKSVNLRENKVFEYTSVKDITEFKILVGKSEHINSILSNILPTEFELGNNFPNPFNPSTTFQVSIPQPSEIKLSIYNILGEEIKTLYNESVEAGKHWFQWDGKDEQGFVVPSGIYFYNLTGNNGINISKKMILMK